MVESEALEENGPESHAWGLIVLGVMFAVAALGWFAGPYGAALSAVGVVMTPLGVLAVLVHVGADKEWARGCALALMLAMAGLVILVFVQQAEELLRARSGGVGDALSGRVYLIAGLSALGMVLALLVLMPAVQRRLAQVLPLESGNFAHALAVAIAVTLSVSAFVPLIVLGEPVMSALAAETARSTAAKSGSAGPNESAELFEQVYQLLWMLPVCLLAAGFGVRRGFRATLARLGLARPTGKQVLAAFGLACALAFVALLLGGVIRAVWQALDWSGTNRDDVQALMGYILTPVGALVVGVCAGLGEELLVRGVLQPRLGLVLSNTVFTAMHAGQYGWDMLIVIFFVGTVFGLVRARTNTTVSALVHGFYDAVLIGLAVSAGG